MSHEITVREDGTVEAAYALKPAWHGLGTVLSDTPFSDQMKLAANLDWLVNQEQLYIHRVEEKDGEKKVIHVEVSDFVANTRGDNGNVLGIVTSKYKVVQNSEAFDFVDGLWQDGLIKYEAAGSLKGGKSVWLLARMPAHFHEISDIDRLEEYILFTTAHDGTRAVQIVPTSVRVVCQNTLNLAMGTKKNRAISIQHKGNVMDKLDDARKAILTVRKQFDTFYAQADEMVKVEVDIEQMRAFANMLLPNEKGKANTRRIKARASIMRAFTDGPQNLPGVRGTAWAAFNAMTQYIDHEKGYKGKNTDAKAESRMNSTLFGSNSRMKHSALNLVNEVVGATG